MKADALILTKPDLAWNERGQIGCAALAHAPFEGSDVWKREHWVVITPRLAAGLKLVHGHPPACDACAAVVPS